MQSHRSVMLHASLAGLTVRENGVYVDATFGRGGHSRAVLAALGSNGRLHAFDRDPQAVDTANQLQLEDPRLIFHCRCYSEMTEALAADQGTISGILFDLGVSSPQLDDPQRGFSFREEGPLDMRMDPSSGEPASAWLARAEEHEIADVLFHYGDERKSRRIARAIVRARLQSPILTTADLEQVVFRALGGRRGKIHPATRSFQAIRIHINGELDRLRLGLQAAVDMLAPGGRLVVISFHSLEDRIVKRFMRDLARAEVPLLRLCGKPQFPTDDESRDNPRARSAVLRVAERLAEPEAH